MVIRPAQLILAACSMFGGNLPSNARKKRFAVHWFKMYSCPRMCLAETSSWSRKFTSLVRAVVTVKGGRIQRDSGRKGRRNTKPQAVSIVHTHKHRDEVLRLARMILHAQLHTPYFRFVRRYIFFCIIEAPGVHMSCKYRMEFDWDKGRGSLQKPPMIDAQSLSCCVGKEPSLTPAEGPDWSIGSQGSS